MSSLGVAEEIFLRVANDGVSSEEYPSALYSRKQWNDFCELLCREGLLNPGNGEEEMIKQLLPSNSGSIHITFDDVVEFLCEVSPDVRTGLEEVDEASKQMEKDLMDFNFLSFLCRVEDLNIEEVKKEQKTVKELVNIVEGIECSKNKLEKDAERIWGSEREKTLLWDQISLTDEEEEFSCWKHQHENAKEIERKNERSRKRDIVPASDPPRDSETCWIVGKDIYTRKQYDLLCINTSMASPEAAEEVFSAVSASKQLVLCHSVPKFCGDSKYEGYSCYHFKHIAGASLRAVVDHFGPINDFTIFRYVARLLLSTFVDLFSKCTIRIRSAITLDDVILTKEFSRIILIHLDWFLERKSPLEQKENFGISDERYELFLLVNFMHLCKMILSRSLLTGELCVIFEQIERRKVCAAKEWRDLLLGEVEGRTEHDDIKGDNETSRGFGLKHLYSHKLFSPLSSDEELTAKHLLRQRLIRKSSSR